jgi:hypothetical protein
MTIIIGHFLIILISEKLHFFLKTQNLNFPLKRRLSVTCELLGKKKDQKEK